jgi:integrase
MNCAVSWGWIEKNRAAFAHPPALGRRRAPPPAPAKVAALLNTASTDDVEFGVFLWLALTTGARRGELTALRWSSLDVERGELVIEENCVVAGRPAPSGRGGTRPEPAARPLLPHPVVQQERRAAPRAVVRK